MGPRAEAVTLVTPKGEIIAKFGWPALGTEYVETKSVQRLFSEQRILRKNAAIGPDCCRGLDTSSVTDGLVRHRKKKKSPETTGD